MRSSKVIALFDFDGTLTTSDTLFPFLESTFSYANVGFALLKAAPQIAGAAVSTNKRNQAKAIMLKSLFAKQEVEEVEKLGKEFAASYVPHVLREKGLQRIKWHKDQGHWCIMVSASLDVYLKPIAHELGFDDLLCTRMHKEGPVYTGAIEGFNCRREEKVRLVKRLIGESACSTSDIYVYGDSKGDKEMLAMAKPEKRFYRPFL